MGTATGTNRRHLYRIGAAALAACGGLVVAVPGFAFLLDPLRRKARRGEPVRLTRLSELKPGEPRSFPVIEERRDAWVKYPEEPVGSVWLVRQPAGANPPVLALSAECPHLGCTISRAADDRSFVCRCHKAAFDGEGKPLNDIAPRPMDRLTVELTAEDDPVVVVRFQRFLNQKQEQIPLV